MEAGVVGPSALAQNLILKETLNIEEEKIPDSCKSVVNQFFF